ncbi:MAG: 3-phosphoshikimate 1-carboxyvinyltransferase [bacterium]|nr:3-phosphoshikimate 1-carboxyvinyltransferase [bacterium]
MGTNIKIAPGGRILGYMPVPGDKSISIRAVLVSSISDGVSLIRGLGTGDDIISARKCVEQLGIKTIEKGKDLQITGKGLKGFLPADKPLDCGNSGTTLRLLTGIIAGQNNEYVLTGDNSLKERPMARIVDPLRLMGAHIEYLDKEGRIPIRIKPSKLKGIKYKMPVASAQLKSSLLFAGMYASGTTTITEPARSRDHTEIMLDNKGVKIIKNGLDISIKKPDNIPASDILVPGDISGAAFFIVLATLLSNSELTIRNVCINDTRRGVIDVLDEMGADITIIKSRRESGELVAELEVRSAKLTGIGISGDVIPGIIDEIPVIAVAASLAKGKTVIMDAEELRVKESDRISAVYKNLKRMGVNVEEKKDGLIIKGTRKLKGSILESYNDHRIAMAFSVAACAAEGHSMITDSEWADISFPGFYSILHRLRELNHHE